MEINGPDSVREFAVSWLMNDPRTGRPSTRWRYHLESWADQFPIHLVRDEVRRDRMAAAMAEARHIARMETEEAQTYLGLRRPGPHPAYHSAQHGKAYACPIR